MPIIYVNNIEFTMDAKLAATIPYFANNMQEIIKVKTDIAIELYHLVAMHNMLYGNMVIPMKDLTSHLDVYKILQFGKNLGITIDTFIKGFRNWTKHDDWVNLSRPEYIYLLYEQSEELVDYNKFFIHYDNWTDIIKAAKLLPEMMARPDLIVDMLSFVKKFNFALCFDDNNKVTQCAMQRLIQKRNDNWSLFLINPHEEHMFTYFNHVPSLNDVWSCEGISVIEAPNIGANTISPYTDCIDRFEKFSHDITNKPFNTSIKTPFPHHAVIFAGGSITKLLDVNYNPKYARQSDVDMFICGNSHNERAKNFEDVLNWFNTYDPNVVLSKTYYAIIGSVTNIYIKNIDRKFQIISMNISNPYEVISRFDLTHIQWCLYQGTFLGTPEACRSMRSKVTMVDNTKKLRVIRMIKALYCGYNIYKDNNIIEILDITSIITADADGQTPQLQKLLRELHGFYYPKDDPQMDHYELKQYILSMIEKDSNAAFITDDPKIVQQNVTIGGSFDTDYQSILFNTFNPMMINNKIDFVRYGHAILRTKLGSLRLTTCTMVITSINSTDAVNILAKPHDNSFIEFVRSLEEDVYKTFCNKKLTSYLVDANSSIKFNIPRYKIDARYAKGRSYARNQRGAALIVEEDLQIGDEIQILFMIKFYKLIDNCSVELCPIMIIKYCKYVINDEETEVLEPGEDEELTYDE